MLTVVMPFLVSVGGDPWGAPAVAAAAWSGLVRKHEEPRGRTSLCVQARGSRVAAPRLLLPLLRQRRRWAKKKPLGLDLARGSGFLSGGVTAA
jgi:hypothetical protein